jgi:hypothetical protein
VGELYLSGELAANTISGRLDLMSCSLLDGLEGGLYKSSGFAADVGFASITALLLGGVGLSW